MTKNNYEYLNETPAAKPRERYWTGDVNEKDDFDDPIADVFIDGRTQMGPWAIMTPKSFKRYGVGVLGTGLGQRYVKTDQLGPTGQARWLKAGG